MLYIASRRIVISPHERQKFGIQDVVNSVVREDELPDFESDFSNRHVLALYYSSGGELCIGEMTNIKD